MTSQHKNKKVTFYAIVEETKETAKKIKDNSILFQGNNEMNGKQCSCLLFPSFRGSLVDAAEKVSYEKLNWIRLVLKASVESIQYPTYQFEQSSDVPFYLLDAYEESFEKAAKSSDCPPKYIENGKELGSILKIRYIDGEEKRFSFLYKDKDSDMKFLSPVYTLKEKGELFQSVVDWFINENNSFKSYYNLVLRKAVMRQPSEITDVTNPNIVTVINPANVAVVCTDIMEQPALMQVTKINNRILPVRSDYKYFLKQDMTNQQAFNLLETPQGRRQIGWKYTIQGGTNKTPHLKKGKEKIKLNMYSHKIPFWKRFLTLSKKSRVK